tara:strand:+ start:14072 stop:14653 length:582 start_codon:yes stop_codon:yes gene_type:complete
MAQEKQLKFSSNTIKKLKDEKINWQKGIENNEWTWIQYFKEQNDFSLGFELCEKDAWIARTLKTKKKRYKFKECKTLILVGSGLYPYSLFDIHKQYPYINLIGLDYDERCVKIGNLLIKAANVENKITILHMDGNDFDYSKLEHEDLVFLSVDIETRAEIYNKVLKTSKADVYVCEPHNKWLINMIEKSPQED